MQFISVQYKSITEQHLHLRSLGHSLCGRSSWKRLVKFLLPPLTVWPAPPLRWHWLPPSLQRPAGRQENTAKHWQYAPGILILQCWMFTCVYLFHTYSSCLFVFKHKNGHLPPTCRFFYIFVSFLLISAGFEVGSHSLSGMYHCGSGDKTQKCL